MVTLRLVIFVVFIFGSVYGDNPCAARDVSGQSVVCVCNSTYCDSVTREPRISGKYVVYTSSKSGFRFNKTTGTLVPAKSIKTCKLSLRLDPTRKFQTIFGFGGAVTDAAGINWKNLSQPLQEYLVKSYFSSDGISYNMVRVPIGGCDFSTHKYAYNELPVNDTKLTNFSLSYEDYQYKIPFIKAAMQWSKEPIHVLATTWSPPPWMKSNNAFGGYSRLKPEYYQTYADYHYKFIEKYTAEGIPIWGISTTNEPTNALLGLVSFSTLGWTAETMGDWIVNNLGPTIRNSTFKDTKILAVDDQRIFIYYWWNTMIMYRPQVLDYVDGVGLHYYTDMITPAALQVEAMRGYPDKFLLYTEACEGSIPMIEKHVSPGSWNRASRYISDIITNLNHDSVGWIDWNLCLNKEGGPNWDENYVDSPIIVHPDLDEFHKQPMFYAMGHVAKFIPRGSVRMGAWSNKSIFTSFESVAVLTPENIVVVVLYNSGSARTFDIILGGKAAVIHSPEESITTVEIPYEP